MPKPGEVCVRCGTVIRAVTTRQPMLQSPTEPAAPSLVCGAGCMDPRGPSDEDPDDE